MNNNLVGPLGLEAIARGTLYPEYPPIFPMASAAKKGATIHLTHLIGLNSLNFVPEPDARFKHSGKITFIGAMTTGISSNYSYLAGMTSAFFTCAYMCYESYSTVPSSRSIYLSPQPSQDYPPISYDSDIDQIVQGAEINSQMIFELDKAFREYRLNVFGSQLLEQKIRTIVDQSLRIEQPLMEVPSFLHQAEALFTNKQNIQNIFENGVIFFGSTGVGKTTVANYLYGCKMKTINSLFFRRQTTEKNQYVIIAENSIAEIGHKFGVNSSQTFQPNIFNDEKNGLVYCDCPGPNDNRESAVAICNARMIVDVLKSSKVQAFLFFIEYGDLHAGRGEKVLENLKYLQRLLKNFYDFSQNVLFVINKAPFSARESSIKGKLTQALKSCVDTPSFEDRLFQDFCDQVIRSGVLNTQLIICHPERGQSRKQLIKKIKEKPPLDFRSIKLGFPFSVTVHREAEQARHMALEKVKMIFSDLKTILHTEWNNKIGMASNPRESEECYVALFRFSRNQYKLENWLNLHHSSFPNLSDHLKKGIKDWEMANCLLDNKQKIEDVLNATVKEMNDEITSLIKDATEHYYSQTSEPLKTPEIESSCVIL